MNSTIKSHDEEQHMAFSDGDFVRQFASCQLEPAWFTHKAHLRLAWIYLQNHNLDEAIEQVRTDIKRFVAFAGAESKYNDTLTVAAVRIVNRFVKAYKTKSFEKFILANDELLTDFKALVMQHYKTDIFTSEVAKKRFINPDLIPFED
jgi:hypothetical protein